MQEIRFDGKLDYIIDYIGFVKVLRNADFTIRYKNGKERYSLIFLEDGEMNYHFTNAKMRLAKGNVLFIPKNEPYTATYTADGTVAKVLIFDVVSNLFPDRFKSVVVKADDRFSDVYKTISDQNANHTLFLASKIYELFYILQQENRVVPNPYKKIIPALEEIQKFYFENQKISYYAGLCYMSESNFRKLFKEYTGKSPIEYRNLIRMMQAKKMIKSGEYTVQEAAYLNGFNNMSFFYEIYKRYLSD